ncbi:unnamed protein product [Schistocephalus solidus]|uniref:AraC family transcriptional regulator n=1 Tax=Schistocephalus solidus TaxID=70667 RepID=A0A183SEW6_SCHSO|nr:unnamed protein product [Schistocephalus solidus]
MRIQIDVAVETVSAGIPSFEEFACLFGASHGDHFSSLPSEVVVAINGVRKHERQGILSADEQLMFVYAGPESLACMAYASARAIRTLNATFVMRIQIDVAVETVSAGIPSFEEFACLFGASHGDHFSSLPSEVVVAINGVRKHERQGILSADEQLMFVYAGPESLACMAYASARAIRTLNAWIRISVDPLLGLSMTGIVNIPDRNRQDNELVVQWLERCTSAQHGHEFEARAPQRLGLGMAG